MDVLELIIFVSLPLLVSANFTRPFVTVEVASNHSTAIFLDSVMDCPANGVITFIKGRAVMLNAGDVTSLVRMKQKENIRHEEEEYLKENININSNIQISRLPDDLLTYNQRIRQ